MQLTKTQKDTESMEWAGLENLISTQRETVRIQREEMVR